MSFNFQIDNDSIAHMTDLIDYVLTLTVNSRIILRKNKIKRRKHKQKYMYIFNQYLSIG